MEQFDWQPFLKQWAEEMLDVAEDTDDLNPEAVEAGWFGFPGATEEQIIEVEARLGVTLPPSYKEFLKVTNGWRQPEALWAASAGSLWQTNQVQWFAVANQDWIDAYSQSYQAEGHLQTVLQVSDDGDGVYLLNPKVVDSAGEWEAWFFANWNPGAERYRSFQEMMQAQYQSWKNGLPLMKGEMTQEEYEAYASAMDIKNV